MPNEEDTRPEPSISSMCPAVSVGLKLLEEKISPETFTEILGEVRRITDELAAEERNDHLTYLDLIMQRRRKEGY